MGEFLKAQNFTNEETRQNISSLAQGYQTLKQGMARLEIQVGQMATNMSERPKGALPSQPEPNPRGGKVHECNAITTLGSRKVYDNHVYMSSLSSYQNILFDDDVDDYYYDKEDETRRYENVPSDNLDKRSDVTLYTKKRNKRVDKEAGREENVPSGRATIRKGYGFLSFENDASKYGLIDSGKERALLQKKSSRDENVSDPRLDGEAMIVKDPSRVDDTSRKIIDEFDPSSSREK